MAVRDQSKGIAFLYTNVHNLYKKSLQPKPNLSSRVLRAEDLGNVKIAKFEFKNLAQVQTIDNAEVTNIHAFKPRAESQGFQELKANIKKLEEMQSKLRFMLQEMEDLVAKKSR